MQNHTLTVAHNCLHTLENLYMVHCIKSKSLFNSNVMTSMELNTSTFMSNLIYDETILEQFLVNAHVMIVLLITVVLPASHG